MALDPIPAGSRQPLRRGAAARGAPWTRVRVPHPLRV